MTDEPERELEPEAEGPEQDITSEAPEIVREEAASATPADDSDDDGTEAEIEEAGPAPKLERLQKILAQAGIASRRHAEELITGGHVQVNGQVVTALGSKADAARDHIRVDGKLLQGAERLRYFMLNKPRGFVTTVTDPEGRPTVMQFFAKESERLYPVGRLDYLSEGLLLMTNDGTLANALSKAAAGVEKTYLVKISGVPPASGLQQIRSGIMIDRGRLDEVRSGRRDRIITSPAKIELVRGGENPWYELTLTEGRNRQIRKMFEEIGHHVEKIRRIGYGALRLDVAPGEFRELTLGEVMALDRAAKGKKVVPKKKTPEFAQLKSPAKKKSTRPRRQPTVPKSASQPLHSK